VFFFDNIDDVVDSHWVQSYFSLINNTNKAKKNTSLLNQDNYSIVEKWICIQQSIMVVASGMIAKCDLEEESLSFDSKYVYEVNRDTSVTLATSKGRVNGCGRGKMNQ
jgi:hypothetical protein